MASDFITAADKKVPVLWFLGSADTIISDMSSLDLAVLGKLNVIPGWPGDEVVPPQPMISQTRAVLDKYKQNGGSYKEVVLDAGHSPYLEKEEEFNAEFFAFIVENTKQ